MLAYELALASPVARPVDIYSEHQLVWQAMHGLPDGRDFLYHWDSERRRIQVRCKAKRPGAKPAILPRAGRCRILMLAARQGISGYTRVLEEEAPRWFSERMARAGFHVEDVSIRSSRQSEGRKGELRISLPTVEFDSVFAVADAALARTSYINGIGRGKRFGLGMLRVV